jgi:hypothetical protein
LPELVPQQLKVQMQVLRVILPIGIKALVDGKLGRDAARERNRDAVLEELARRLDRVVVLEDGHLKSG